MAEDSSTKVYRTTQSSRRRYQTPIGIHQQQKQKNWTNMTGDSWLILDIVEPKTIFFDITWLFIPQKIGSCLAKQELFDVFESVYIYIYPQ